MTGNMYWAGAFPGLLLATAVSAGLARGLVRPGLKHILWLVPLLHFAFALGVGPAISLAYGLIVVPAAGGWAGWLWLAGALAILGAIAAARATRAAGSRGGPWLATTAACLLIAGVLIPPFYHLIAG
ncbi:MAG: hypothetical protein Q8O07_05910 [Chloroflexota bacterium]|nr:hypothetical protein [Chloroflexota bacterium]